MSWIVNTPIYDTFVLRDGANAVILNKATGDFATAEAYAVAASGTTASLTITHLNNGEYQTLFTPSTGGPAGAPVIWTVHVVYNSGGTFREWSQTYDVFASATAAGATISGTSYATLAELRERMDSPDADTESDAIYTATIAAASRSIDGYCGRRFYQLANEIRYFTAEFPTCLDLDDLVSVSALVTDDGNRTYGDTWSATDYDLWPYDASNKAFPYTRLDITPTGRFAFPRVPKGVKVTATWGWPSVPDPVNEACLILAMRYAKRPSAPFAIEIGSMGDQGAAMRIPVVDPDVKGLLAPYRRVYVGAV